VAQQLFPDFGDAGSSPRVRVPLEAIFSFNNFLNMHYIAKVTNTELPHIKQLMGYQDAQ